MPQYRVKIESLHVGEDGKDVLLAANGLGGRTIGLEFSANDLDRLLAAVAHAATLSMQRRLADASVRKLVPVLEWESGRIATRVSSSR